MHARMITSKENNLTGQRSSYSYFMITYNSFSMIELVR